MEFVKDVIDIKSEPAGMETSTFLNEPSANQDENFILERNDFGNGLITAVKELQHSNLFSDLTLLPPDLVPIKVHRFVLASGSGFFRQLFEQSPNLPTVFMNQVDRNALELVLTLLYTGQARVSQSEMESVSKLTAELSVDFIQAHYNGSTFLNLNQNKTNFDDEKMSAQAKGEHDYVANQVVGEPVGEPVGEQPVDVQTQELPEPVEAPTQVPKGQLKVPRQVLPKPLKVSADQPGNIQSKVQDISKSNITLETSNGKIALSEDGHAQCMQCLKMFASRGNAQRHLKSCHSKSA